MFEQAEHKITPLTKRKVSLFGSSQNFCNVTCTKVTKKKLKIQETHQNFFIENLSPEVKKQNTFLKNKSHPFRLLSNFCYITCNKGDKKTEHSRNLSTFLSGKFSNNI